MVMGLSMPLIENIAKHFQDKEKLNDGAMALEYKGYKGAIIMHPKGYLLGYVTVPEGHSDYGKDYDELYHYDVHGGLTYSNYSDSDKGTGWVIGFDCSHSGDFVYGSHKLPYCHDVYRDIKYVRENIKYLIDQLEDENQC